MSKYLFRKGDGNEGNFPRFEAEYGIHATVYEGPHGEQAFGAAWLTAELQPADDDDDHECYAIRKLLDPAALRLYRAEMKAA
jgi:hypothetical protein